MNPISLLLSRGRPSTLVWALLVLAAVAVAVAGYLHGRLFWQGYSHVDVVGPLFLINVVASGAVIVLLALGFPLLFAAGALGISLGAIVSILISHSTSFFGFAENGFDSRATIIVVAEAVAAALCLAAVALGRESLVAPARAERVSA